MSGGADLSLRRPGAGREPAATGLIRWLQDEQAPRLCLLTGASGAGKSHLLAWLVQFGGTRTGGDDSRRVHAVAPMSGVGVRGAVWLIADDLRVSARASGELMEAVAADQRRTVIVVPELHGARDPAAVADEVLLPLLELPNLRMIVEARSGSTCAQMLRSDPRAAVMDLAEDQWTNPTGFQRWAAAAGADDPEDSYPSPGDALGWSPGRRSHAAFDDLGPQEMVGADPHWVTAALEEAEAAGRPVGRLGQAWLRRGQSLCRDQPPSARALVLLAALGHTDDEHLQAELAGLARPEPWRVLLSLTQDDAEAGWPGPAAAMSGGVGQHAEHLLIADHLGAARSLSLPGWSVRGRVDTGQSNVARAVCCLPEGTVLVLDEWGRTRIAGEIARPGLGDRLRTLVDFGDDPWKALRDEVMGLSDTLPGETGLTAATAIDEGVAFGDDDGVVHAITQGGNGLKTASSRLHVGRVSALTAVQLADDGPTLVYSGGVDGRVRAWGVGAEPMPTPVLARSLPVTALSARTDTLAVAWADGLVQVHAPTISEEFRPGAPVRALHLGPDHALAIGMDDAFIVLSPAAQAINGTVHTPR